MLKKHMTDVHPGQATKFTLICSCEKTGVHSLKEPTEIKICPTKILKEFWSTCSCSDKIVTLSKTDKVLPQNFQNLQALLSEGRTNFKIKQEPSDVPEVGSETIIE